jgi:lipopolysaccharide transport system permease protein
MGNILKFIQTLQSNTFNFVSAQINRWPRTKRYVGYWILIYTLAKRDIIARYRRSALGIFWAVLDPLFFMLVFGILRIFLGISSGDMPYLVFLFSGLTPWTFFLNIVNSSPPSIIANASIIKKIAIPRELFLLVSAITALFDFCMSLIIMFLLMVIYRIPFTVHLLWLPFLTGVLMVFALGAGMWISAYGIFRRDIIKFSAYFFQLLFYLSPIFYPIAAVPVKFQKLYSLNPFVGILTGFRNVLGSGTMPNLELLAYSLPIVLIIFIIGWINFRQRSIYFGDYL